MSTNEVFDVCVVGAGLWGSAAAKYCSERDGTTVCLVGPSEPATVQERNQRSVFGAHYDEGRIYRVLSSSYEWGQLAKRSIKKYQEIEGMAGVQFSENVGFMYVTVKDSMTYKNIILNSRQNGAVFEVLSREDMRHKMDYLSLEQTFNQKNEDVVAVSESEDAGYISPRSLLLAQQTIARRHGCQVVDDTVERVSPRQSDDSILELTTERGKTIHARKVLLCTGASTSFKELLPLALTLDITVVRELVVMVELAETELARLRGMPCLVVQEDQDSGQNCYILPPIKYPDGRYYLKIGHLGVGQTEMTSSDELKAWFCGTGDSETSDRLRSVIRRMFPDLRPVSTHVNTCVCVNTPTRQLYCDMVTPRLGVLVGGNGCGAKSSDEIGRMGANMILQGDWDYDMPRETFRAQWKPKD